MGLFDFPKKKPSDVKVEVFGYENGKPVKLETGGKIEKVKPVEYYRTIEREIKPLENVMVEFAVSAKHSKKVTDRIKALEGVVGTYYTLKEKCSSLGKDYIKYFSDMWENCRNSSGITYIDRHKQELKELKSNFFELYKEDVLHERESANLEARVLKVLQDNPAILQTEVYKHFDKIVQKDVQSIIYFLEKRKRIRREKSGRTYMVYYVK